MSSPSSSSSNIGVPLPLLGLSPVILWRLLWPLGVEAEVDADGRLIRPDIVVAVYLVISSSDSGAVFLVIRRKGCGSL